MPLAETDLFAGVSRVLFVHAHPDDETLATGPLIAGLAASGVDCRLVTCSRGERGEIVPGSLSPDASQEMLVDARTLELAQACQILGVERRAYLGEAPFLAPGSAPHRYLDSGMSWIRPGLAGPAPDSTPDCFSRSDIDQQIADLVAGIRAWRPQRLVSYDADGGYGHPDHKRCHEITLAASRQLGIEMVEVLEADSDPTGIEQVYADPDVEPQVIAALRCYHSQLQVLDGQPPMLRHVGGQEQQIPREIRLRVAQPATKKP